MKTVVSIPNDIFKKAEQLARRMKKSRNELFSNVEHLNGLSGDFPGRHLVGGPAFSHWIGEASQFGTQLSKRNPGC
jgi:hypothetical protein